MILKKYLINDKLTNKNNRNGRVVQMARMFGTKKYRAKPKRWCTVWYQDEDSISFLSNCRVSIVRILI